MWFDAGVNLTNQRLLKDLDGVIARAEAAQVTRQLIIATNESESRAALQLCEQFPGKLVASVGVHPHEADHVSDHYVDVLASLASHPAAVAIGECGLDFNRNFSSAKAQINVFAEQIQLANHLNLPLYLHERDALDEQLDLLATYCADHTQCLSHCFTGGPDAAQAYLKRGHWFGLTGWLCDERRNQALLEAFPSLPRERIVLETDAPFLLPRNVRPRPKMNEPALLPFVGQQLAQLWQLPIEQVAALTSQTAERLFSISGGER